MIKLLVLNAKTSSVILSKKKILAEFILISFITTISFYCMSLFEVGSLYIQLIVWLFNIILISFILIRLKQTNQSIDDFGLSFKLFVQIPIWRIVITTFVVLFLGVAAFIFGSIIASFFTEIPTEINTGQYNPIKGNLLYLVLSLGFVAIASSFGEELIYRAYLMDRVSRFFKKPLFSAWFSILISAAIFGVAHFQWGLLGVIQTFFMGLVFSISYLKFRGNIWNNVIAHFYMDAILLIQLYLT